MSYCGYIAQETLGDFVVFLVFGEKLLSYFEPSNTLKMLPRNTFPQIPQRVLPP